MAIKKETTKKKEVKKPDKTSKAGSKSSPGNPTSKKIAPKDVSKSTVAKPRIRFIALPKFAEAFPKMTTLKFAKKVAALPHKELAVLLKALAKATKLKGYPIVPVPMQDSSPNTKKGSIQAKINDTFITAMQTALGESHTYSSDLAKKLAESFEISSKIAEKLEEIIEATN